MTSSTPGRLSKTGASSAPLLPVMPIAVRCAPGMGWALNPRASIASDDAADLLRRRVLSHHHQHVNPPIEAGGAPRSP